MFIDLGLGQDPMTSFCVSGSESSGSITSAVFLVAAPFPCSRDTLQHLTSNKA
jgi:hypothetical protein